MMDEIRYYAKENCLGETFYFASYIEPNRRITVGHLNGVECLNNPLSMFLIDYPESNLINGPNEKEKEGTDGFGKFKLRPLNLEEKSKLTIL